MLKLCYAPGACSFAPHVALEETGAAFEAIRIAVAAGEQREPPYLAINPHGRVPALITDSGVVTENIAVLTYIATRFPDAKLLPLGDPARLARAYELMSWFASTVHVNFAQIFRSERFTDDDGIKPALKADGRKRFHAACREIEGIAAAGPWMLGATYSVVDPYAYVIWKWSQRLEIDAAEFPAWAAQVHRLLERPAVQRAVARESAT